MSQHDNQDPKGTSRRDFLKILGATAGATVLEGCQMSQARMDWLQSLVQSNFRELSKAEIQDVLGRLQRTYSAEYGKEIKVSAAPALDNTLFGYALDLGRCTGCRQCVYGCVEENNQSRDPQIHWIRVLEMEKEKGIDFNHANEYYNPENVPEEGKFYLPVACQHCENPPCVKVCPVGATWKEKDGIVVIDYDWCIGCRCCITACPYGARHFNWGEPGIPSEEINAETHYLGNRPRKVGVVEKCSFCIQRVREGKYPKCVEVCPVGARKFGNLLDPESEIRHILATKQVFVLKAELNTQPKFFYYFG